MSRRDAAVFKALWDSRRTIRLSGEPFGNMAVCEGLADQAGIVSCARPTKHSKPPRRPLDHGSPRAGRAISAASSRSG